LGIDHVAAGLNLHTYDDGSGNYDHRVERMLSALEGRFRPALRKLLDGGFVTGEDQAWIAAFVMSMRSRVPSEVEPANKFFSEIIQDVVDPRREHWEITAEYPWTLVHVLRAGMECGEIIMRMGWRIATSDPPNFFITSDRPVAVIDPSYRGGFWGVGLANQDVEVTIPLSRTVALIAGWKYPGKGPAEAPVGLVEQINIRTSQSATRELIAPAAWFPGVEECLRRFHR
jgi:hypothetical protein